MGGQGLDFIGLDVSCFPAAGEITLERITSTSLVGGWLANGPVDDESVSITFLEDGTFMLLHGNNPGDTCGCGQAGIEYGTYTWDPVTNDISFSVQTDTNGEFAFAGLLPSVAGAGPGTGYTVVETVPPGSVATTPAAYSTDLLGREELVALPGQAELLPGDPRVEVVVGVPLMFGNVSQWLRIWRSPIRLRLLA